MSRRIAGILHYVALVSVAAGWHRAYSAQATERADQERVSANVPFVGCKSSGQVESFPAPKEASYVVRIDEKAAQRLAYYESAVAPGVLAPRGWFCEAASGSGGSLFLIAPEPITDFMRQFTGPAIELDDASGENSGRVEIAEVVARVFPIEWAFARSTIEGYDLLLKFGPYPKDRLTYKGDRVVEYRTPPNSEGLGTRNRMRAANEAIEGVAILQGHPPNTVLHLVRLAIRLPGDMKGLELQITRQLETESRKQTER